MTNEPSGQDPARTPQAAGADEPAQPTPGTPEPAADAEREPVADAAQEPVADTAQQPVGDAATEPAPADPTMPVPASYEADEPYPAGTPYGADASPADTPAEGGPAPTLPEPVTPAPTGAPSGTFREERLGGGAYPPPNVPPPPPPPPPPPADSPRFGTPPPGGWGFAPGTDGFAVRYGLARPKQGRVLAGVCAAIGRATNTDPVLWRVLFAVFALAGGLGIVLYLVGWLLIPAEGDSGSPLEALFGRGRTSTNPFAVLVGAIAAAIGLSLVISAHRFWSVFVVVGIVVVLVAVGSRNGHLPGTRMAGPPPVPPRAPNPVPPTGQPAWYGAPPAPQPTAPPGYRPAFAPHGPYAQGPYAPGTATPPPGRPNYPYPGLTTPPPRPPRPPKPPRERSKLTLLTCSVTLLAMGVLGVLDLVGLSIPLTAYLALALAVVGVGMIVGTWLGRGRGLIGIGLLVALVLGVSTLTGHVGRTWNWHGGAGEVTWRPANITEVADRYTHGFGDSTLDLTAVDFAGQDKTVEVQVNAGNVRVRVPSTVDVQVHARVDAGNGDIFGHHWDGVNTAEQTISDQGADGPGGGMLVLNIHLNAGNVEVTR